jgi:hypothetical protein
MTYFIATPAGDLYFKSDYVKQIKIKRNIGGEFTFTGIEFLDMKMFEKFSKLYKWDDISVYETNNGLFLHIELSDPYYGAPYYKIFQ